VVHPAARGNIEARVNAVRLPHIGLFSIRVSNFRVVSPDTRDYYSMTVPLDAPIQILGRRGLEGYGEGDVHFQHAQDPFDLAVSGTATTLVANFDAELVRSFGQGLEIADGFDLQRLARRISLATPEGASLRRYLAFLWREVAHDGAFARSPVATREIELSLLAMVILAAENQTKSILKSGNVSLPPAHMRRAEEYLAAHVDSAVSMADLAVAAGASARTLFRTFKKQHRISPMAFLKQRRLEAAHRALLAAEPGSTTVSEVARRYYFFHFGRFADDYQRIFLEKPSETLRR
jgi:AraC-like DNA-binding protein